MAWIFGLIGTINHLLTPASGASFPLLMLVAAGAACGLVFHRVTRGREFLICGYSSVVFLLPLVQWH